VLPGYGLDEVLAHELAHAIDPHLSARGSAMLDEAYAETLGPLLLAHQPPTIEAAQALVPRQAIDRPEYSAGIISNGLPPRGSASVLLLLASLTVAAR